MVRRFCDSGWLFLLAGLALCAAGILLPAQQHVSKLRHQLHGLNHQHRLAMQHLELHARVLNELSNDDPALIKRLAAAHFNVVPAGERPVLRNAHAAPTLVAWIEHVAQSRQRMVQPARTTAPADTTLARLVTGPYRLWVLAGGAMCIFIGLILTPMLSRRATTTAKPAPMSPPDPQQRTIVVIDQDTHQTTPVQSPSRAPESFGAGAGFTAYASNAPAIISSPEATEIGDPGCPADVEEDHPTESANNDAERLIDLTESAPSTPSLSTPSLNPQSACEPSENVEVDEHHTEMMIDDTPINTTTFASRPQPSLFDVAHHTEQASAQAPDDDEHADYVANTSIRHDEVNDDDAAVFVDVDDDDDEYEDVDEDEQVIDDDADDDGDEPERIGEAEVTDVVDESDADEVEQNDEADDEAHDEADDDPENVASDDDEWAEVDDDEEDDDSYEYVWVDDQGNVVDEDAGDEWGDDAYEDDEDETDDLPVATDAGEDDDEYEYVYVDEAGNIVDDADADDEEEDDEWIDEDEGVDDEDLDEEQPDDVDIDDAYEYVWVDDDGNIIEGEEDEEDEDEQWEVH